VLRRRRPPALAQRGCAAAGPETAGTSRWRPPGNCANPARHSIGRGRSGIRRSTSTHSASSVIC